MSPRMKNRDVVTRFVTRREDGNNGYGSVTSSDGALHSYGATIAEWDGATLVVHAGWDGYSRTTSKHFKYLHDALKESRADVRISWDGDGRKKDRWVSLND